MSVYIVFRGKGITKYKTIKTSNVFNLYSKELERHFFKAMALKLESYLNYLCVFI